mmetsp:Transcript_6073/g.7034  ORF Transcript_6073/g.7034 Transcript_6073/m.7034 type:complete len:88 (+) Transcript_6073:338-601(+)
MEAFYSRIKNSQFTSSAQILKVNVKRDIFRLKSKTNFRTLDSPTLMLQLSMTLQHKAEESKEYPHKLKSEHPRPNVVISEIDEDEES